MPEVTSFSLIAGVAPSSVLGNSPPADITAAEERSDRGQWLRVRNAGRADYRRQLASQGLAAGELNKRCAWFNTETAELALNDLFRFVRDLLHDDRLKHFLREARFAILGVFSDSDSDL